MDAAYGCDQVRAGKEWLHRDGGSGAINYCDCRSGTSRLLGRRGGSRRDHTGGINRNGEGLFRWSRIREKKLCGCEGTKRNYAAAKTKKTIYAATKAKPVAPWTDGYPNIQFVEGPVVDIDFDKDTPYSEVNTLSYIPLLVAGEYLSRWPFADTGTKAPDSRRNARRSSSNEEIRKALRKLLNDEKAAGRKPPNDEELWKMLGAWGIGPRQRVREVLREKEFSSRERLRPGERWRERKTGR